MQLGALGCSGMQWGAVGCSAVQCGAERRSGTAMPRGALGFVPDLPPKRWRAWVW